MKRIEGFVRRSLCVLLLTAAVGAGCSEDPTGSSPDSDEKKENTSINQWMFDYMKTHYLWNEAVQQVTPDYNLDYEKFLDDILEKVAAQKDEKGRPVNYDDGHWNDGERSYFYSNIQRYPKSSSSKSVVTRGTREQAEGLGIEMMYYSVLDDTNFLLLVAAITPGSPADKAGLKRGDVISRVDGSAFTDDKSLNAGWDKLLFTESGTVKVTLIDMNAEFGPDAEKEVTLTAASYDDNPVWKADVLDCGAKKVGYLVYGSFNFYYDDELIAAFSKFRNENIDELVIDLRYNGGGHVVSSTVLATLIAGDAYRGEVYARTTYNASRKSEISDTYRLGKAQYNQSYSNAKHDPIATALASALGLKQVYILCTGYTASASELVVNGLRGLDFDVRLIGETTNGKNVGMEPLEEEFGDYIYGFSPVTFYSENDKGFRDYGSGFAPDVKASDEVGYFAKVDGYHPMEWGDKEHDEMLACALQWIETGVKPVPAKKAETRSGGRFDLHPLPSPRVQEMILPER